MSNDPTIPAGRRASASSSGVRPKLPYCVVVNGQDFACFASKATAESDAETLRRGHARKGFKTEVRVRTRTGFGGAMGKRKGPLSASAKYEARQLHDRLSTLPRVGDAITARELRLYADNDGDLYRQRFLPILKNQCGHIKRGRYDAKKSVKGWLHFVDAAAKKYARETGGSSDVVAGTKWHTMFSAKVRRAVAAQYARETGGAQGMCREYGLAGTRRRR